MAGIAVGCGSSCRLGSLPGQIRASGGEAWQLESPCAPGLSFGGGNRIIGQETFSSVYPRVDALGAALLRGQPLTRDDVARTCTWMSILEASWAELADAAGIRGRGRWCLLTHVSRTRLQHEERMEGVPNRPSRAESLEHAVALLQKQNDIIEHWTTLFFQVESGLFAATALVFYWADASKLRPAIAAIALLAFVGAFIAILLMGFCLRHHEWQGYYIDRAKALQDVEFPVFTDSGGPAASGSTKHRFAELRFYTVLVWLGVFAASVCLLPRP